MDIGYVLINCKHMYIRGGMKTISLMKTKEVGSVLRK